MAGSTDVPYAAIVAGIRDAVIYADHAGTIRAWNDGATAVFGFTSDDAVGQSLDLIVPQKLRAAHWKGFHAAMARGATAGGSEARLTRGAHRDSDRPLYVEMTFAVVLGSDGTAVGSVAVARDVTERHLRERAARPQRDA